MIDQKYNTKLFSDSPEDLTEAAELIKKGEIVGMPTETVYGLAANALNPEAVAKIFEAKGRPSDNPLIVHISDINMIYELAENIPPLAVKIAEELWPAPLTLILPKKDIIPDITSGGLNTVGIRMPDNDTALKLIELSGCPVAAPSANRSGYPSPTSAQHVMNDLYGLIPGVIDGGNCKIGIESTVISFHNDKIIILRPGYITKKELERFSDKVTVHKTAVEKLAENETAESPGMKYQHYSPNAEVFLIDSNFESFYNYALSNRTDNTYLLVFDSDKSSCLIPALTYGDTCEENARLLFEKLRELDSFGADKVFVRAPEKSGVGLAVYNRLIRAAGFKLIML